MKGHKPKVLHLIDAQPQYCREKRGILFRCDKCKKTFEAKDVVLTKWASNVEIAFVRILKIRFRGRDYSTDCPKCGEPHLFGFDRA
jgi:hypothetical protein